MLDKTIQHHFDDAPEDLRATAEKLKGSFYADNCVTSVGNVDELETFIDELKFFGRVEFQGQVSVSTYHSKVKLN